MAKGLTDSPLTFGGLFENTSLMRAKLVHSLVTHLIQNAVDLRILLGNLCPTMLRLTLPVLSCDLHDKSLMNKIE